MDKRGMNRKGRSKKRERFVQINVSFLQSKAWRTLKPASKLVYMELHTRYMGCNNGELYVSLKEAAKLLRMGKTTVQRAYIELKSRGFIILTK